MFSVNSLRSCALTSNFCRHNLSQHARQRLGLGTSSLMQQSPEVRRGQRSPVDMAKRQRTGVVAIVGLAVAHEVGEELGAHFAGKDAEAALLVRVVLDGGADDALDRPWVLLLCCMQRTGEEGGQRSVTGQGAVILTRGVECVAMVLVRTDALAWLARRGFARRRLVLAVVRRTCTRLRVVAGVRVVVIVAAVRVVGRLRPDLVQGAFVDLQTRFAQNAAGNLGSSGSRRLGRRRRQEAWLV